MSDFVLQIRIAARRPLNGERLHIGGQLVVLGQAQRREGRLAIGRARRRVGTVADVVLVARVRGSREQTRRLELQFNN